MVLLDRFLLLVHQLSADTDAAIAQLSAGTIQLSADTDAAIDALSAGTVHDITELSGAVETNETNINNLSAATLALSAVTLTGVSLNDTPLTVSSHVVSVPVAVDGPSIANTTNSGFVADAKAVKEYVEGIVSSSVNYKGTTDAEPASESAVTGDLYIATSAFTVDGKNVEVGDFIIYNGSTWDVIEKNLDGAVTGNLTADTVTLGAGLNSVKSLANGTAGQVLAVGANGPEWADLPELASAVTGTGNVVTDIAVSDHTITFTKDLEAAAKSDLDELSGAVISLSAETVAEFASAFTAINNLSAGTVHDVQELSGVVIAKDIVIAQALNDLNDGLNALSAGTIQLSGDVIAYIDEQIESLDSVGSASTTGHYLTSVTITDGKISAIGEEQIPAATPVTTVAGTTGDTASAVLSGIVTGGTEGHQLTLNATNKIFSAETSDSAVSSVSAVTSESADTADKVANALSFSGYSVSSASSLDTAVSYDGSAAQALTFGTNGNAGLKSMSMTSTGVVDVEVIDCGEY